MLFTFREDLIEDKAVVEAFKMVSSVLESLDLESKERIRSITDSDSPYTAIEPGLILCDATSGAIVVNLRPASLTPNRPYYIKKIDASANTVTIEPDGAETIDGVANKVLTDQYETGAVMSDKVEWHIILSLVGGGADQLTDLSDVNTSTPTNRNVLVADGVDFESRALVEADISDLSHPAEVNDLSAAVVWPFGSQPSNGQGAEVWSNSSGDNWCAYHFKSFDGTTLLGQIGYTNDTADIWFKNEVTNSGFKFRAKNGSGVANTIAEFDGDGASIINSQHNFHVFTEGDNLAIRCWRAAQGGDVELLDNDVVVVRTEGLAGGGWEINNTVTGGGWERALTVSDLAGAGGQGQTITATWATTTGVHTYGSSGTYRYDDNAELKFGTGDDVAVDFDGVDYNIAGIGDFNITGFTDLNFGGRLVPNSLKLPGYTTVQLTDIAHAVNTSDDKEQSVAVFDLTANIPMFATGNADASTWVGEKAGSTITVTPVA